MDALLRHQFFGPMSITAIPEQVMNREMVILNARSIAKRERNIGHPEVAAIIEDLASQLSRLSDLLDVERYKVAIGVQAIARAVQGRKWLSQPGRGSYAWDDERYQQEFGAALDEIETALRPLQAIAQDWSDCPRDPLRVAANRIAALNNTGGQSKQEGPSV